MNDAAPPSSPADASLEAKIKFWEGRIPRDPEDSTAHLQLAAAYLAKAKSSGDFSLYQKTDKLISPLIDQKPDKHEALILLASAKAAQHQFREALALAERAKLIRPREPSIYALIFDTKHELGDLKGAEEALLALYELGPDFLYFARAANLHLVKGQRQEAISNLELALAEAQSKSFSAQDIAWCYVRLGVIQFDQGRFEAAEKYYDAALELLPNGYLPLEHRAELYAAKGRYDEALALYERVIESAPYPEFFEAIGQIHQDRQDVKEAEKWFSRAEKYALDSLLQGDIGYYRYLAQFYSDVRVNPAQAVEYARADLKVRQDMYTYDTLAWALFSANATPEAAEAIKIALSSGVKDASIFCHAALIYKKLGYNEQAKHYSEMALEENPVLQKGNCASL